jgi:DNA-binding transcriptional regulator YiaG
MGNEVAAIRGEMRMDREDFAALFGVHRTTIMRWERDEKPDPSEAVLRWMRDELAKFRAAQTSKRRSRSAAA